MVTHVVYSLLLILFACRSTASAVNYAEAYAGIAFPRGVEDAIVSDRKMSVGDFATEISLSGLLDVAGPISISPHATFLSTSARTTANQMYSSLQLEYRQNDVGLDLMFALPEHTRLRFGAGASYAWWNAAFKYKVDYTSNSKPDDRRFGSDQDWLIRAVGHWLLRDPLSAGVVLKAVVAIPLSQLGGESDGLAAGYAGLGVGFFMPLSR